MISFPTKNPLLPFLHISPLEIWGFFPRQGTDLMFGGEPKEVSPQIMTTNVEITRKSQFFPFSRRDFGTVAVPALKTAFLVYL